MSAQKPDGKRCGVEGLVAALIAVLAAWRVPPSRDPRTPPVDRRGLVLSAAGMSLIVYGVIQAPGWGWASPVTIGVLAAGLAALGHWPLLSGSRPAR